MQPIQVSITVSEPWELGIATNWVPVKGEVIRFDECLPGGRALVRLETPIEYRGATYGFIVASPRLKGRDVRDIVAGITMCAAIIGISGEQALSADPCDISDWRGGLSFVGDIAPQSSIDADPSVIPP
jgi:hypothetical protein